MSHNDSYGTHGPQLQGIKKIFIKLYFYFNGGNCWCYWYPMPKKCKCQVVNLPCKTQCCCCFCFINEKTVGSKDYHNNKIIRVSHFRVWHRKNPQMFLKPREEERKRFVLLMYSLYSSFILLYIIVFYKLLYYHFQSDAELETEKDDAPASPASPSGRQCLCNVCNHDKVDKPINKSSKLIFIVLYCFFFLYLTLVCFMFLWE